MFKRSEFKRGLMAEVRGNLRPVVMELRNRYFRRVWGMSIGQGCAISLEAKLDKTNPRGVEIGDDTAVNFGAVILTHDFARGGLGVKTRIGARCQIGARSIIMPGVTIGDECVVAAGAIVMADVPAHTLVAGNPARAMERGIKTSKLGMIIREQKPHAIAASEAAASTA